MEIIVSIESGERQASVCKLLGLAKTTVSSIWRGRDRLKRSLESANFGKNSKHPRPSNLKRVDAALPAWFKQARSGNIPINGPLQLEKATSLARALGEYR